MQTIKKSCILTEIKYTLSVKTCDKQELLIHLLITHDPQLREPLTWSGPLKTSQGRLTGVKLGQKIHRVPHEHLKYT